MADTHPEAPGWEDWEGRDRGVKGPGALTDYGSSFPPKVSGELVGLKSARFQT